MISIETDISKINAEQWAKLVETSPTASWFQTKACYDFYASLSFMKPYVFAVSEDEQLTGLLCGYIIADGGKLKQYFSRRAIIPGGALLAETISDEALLQLLQTVINSLKNKAIYIEFRNYNDYSAYTAIFAKADFEYQQHLNFKIPTASVEQAFSRLVSTKRRDVRISQKEGAVITEITTNEELAEYYLILQDLYHTKVKTPLFPIEFFEKIITLPECRIFGIKYRGKVIGGSVCVFLSAKAAYEWFVCGIDRKYKNIYSSTLATWAAIQYTAENNYQYFDMMGAGKPNDSYGVRDFKAKFGGEMVEEGRFLCITKPKLYALGKWAIKMLKR
jgi:lipid II:glycine glycyltransferase (peptidoglycan interpeptide bridge formation enzyme)